MAPAVQTTISPYDGSAVAKRDLLDHDALDKAIDAGRAAGKAWRKTPLEHRITILERFLDLFEADKTEIGAELTREMGRPIRYGAGEVGGFLERGRHLVSIARKCLADVPLTDTDKPGFRRYIRREPLGLILVISAWNFPYMIQVGSIVPGLLGGNTLLLKPSPQTPSSSDRIVSLLAKAGLPSGVAQSIHVDFAELEKAVADPRIGHVVFTGSVANGARVERAAANGPGFKGCALELGGKDAAYVREDADPSWAAEQITDAAFFNSGQSCCAVERVYVHERNYDAFVEELVKQVRAYKLGDPSDQETTLGPVISTASARKIREQVSEAVAAGAKSLVAESEFAVAKEGTTMLGPQVLVDVDHTMNVMTEETFGPVVGVMKVNSDDEALKLINDSAYGLTCSIWTNDDDAFAELMPEVEAGTVFQNRADYLDPALAWTGVKDSGRGVTLSALGFDGLTRAKSVHIRRVK